MKTNTRIVQLPAEVGKVETMSDRSVKIVVHTRELPGSEMAVLFDLVNAEGWLLFSPNELQEADIPDEKADASTGNKTQAQRLRGVLYRLWEAKGSQGDSEAHYRTEMEKIIDLYKERLGELDG